MSAYNDWLDEVEQIVLDACGEDLGMLVNTRPEQIREMYDRGERPRRVANNLLMAEYPAPAWPLVGGDE